MKLRNPYTRIYEEIKQWYNIEPLDSFAELHDYIIYCRYHYVPEFQWFQCYLATKTFPSGLESFEVESIAIGAFLNVCRTTKPVSESAFKKLFRDRFEFRFMEAQRYERLKTTYLDPVLRRDPNGKPTKPSRKKYESVESLIDNGMEFSFPEPEPESETLTIMSDFIEQLSDEDPQFAEYIELRYGQNKSVKECSARMGRSENFLSKKYGPAALKRLFVDMMGAETCNKLEKGN